MKKEMSFTKQAMCELHDGKLWPSMKREAGFIGWLVCLVCILAATVLELCLTHTLSGVMSSLIITDMSIAAGLIGMATIATAFNGNKTTVSEKQEPVKIEEDNE